MRSFRTLPALAAIPLTLLVAACGSGHSSTEPPASATASAARLRAPGPVTRASLSPALGSALPAAGLPRGAKLSLTPNSWHAAGRFARAGGLVEIPGSRPQPVLVGFASTSGRWRITFLESAQ